MLAPAVVKAGEGMYIGALGGVNLLYQNNHKCDHDLKYKTGYGVGGTIGYRLCNDIRVEAEFIYRRNELKGSLDCGHRRSYTLMANGLYDIDLCSCITPYIGGGLGAYWDKLSFPHDFCGGKSNKTRFAIQAIAGASYSVWCNTEIFADYHYLWAAKSLQNHLFALGLRYFF